MNLVWLRKQYDGMCNKCGWPSHSEFAHVNPTGLSGRGRGNTRRLANILRYPASYTLLCSECHRKYDEKKRGGGKSTENNNDSIISHWHMT